jgi:hypothetical protein
LNGKPIFSSVILITLTQKRLRNKTETTFRDKSTHQFHHNRPLRHADSLRRLAILISVAIRPCRRVAVRSPRPLKMGRDFSMVLLYILMMHRR